MNKSQIEENLTKIVQNFSKEDFIYELLLAYGLPKTTITLLKKGKHNLSKKSSQIILKKKLFFQESESEDLHLLIDSLQKDESTYRHSPRFIVVTDYKTILAIDTKTKDTLDIEIINIAKHYDFFLPWSNREKYVAKPENEADVKAAEKMAKIYDEIQKDNQFSSKEQLHSLNVFFSRLLFCFFAEDTEIFPKCSFTHFVSHTQHDGSDLDFYLNRLFEVLNTKNRADYPEIFAKFPYVNGGLFGNEQFAPKFSAKSRKMIIECGELDWSAINPDIFGSMIQAVVHTDQRSSMGMHYTSVQNIMKVIDPLFLDELRQEFEDNFENEKKLNQLLNRLENLRIFDPACGSGNFLIIAYKELRKLEIEIFEQIRRVGTALQLPFSRIKLSQFYGIELDDFACEVATLSLWLAEHQMNVKFKEVFGHASPTLPLRESGKIVCDNATRVRWEEVCKKDEGKEIYILGNPPYLGARNQTQEQKYDLSLIFDGNEEYKDSDYVSCWFLKASHFIRNSESQCAFVSTNSICQGEQAFYIWSRALTNDVEIGFAHQSFKWNNSAKNNAGVTCVVIGLRNKSNKKKILFSESSAKIVKNINSYLCDASDIHVKKSKKPISNFPRMVMGNMARDGGNLILDSKDREEILKQNVQALSLIKSFLGSQEFINATPRWCLWIQDENIELARSIPQISNRINRVFQFRTSSSAKTTISYAKIPHKFAQRTFNKGSSIIIPRVSSEKREYIPIGFLDDNTIISDSALAIYGAEPWIFGVLTSKMHMVWVKTVGGKLKTDYRYSAEICYNTFPFPEISEKQKQIIASHVYNILDEREKYPEKTMAELYDPNKMPAGLKQAHHDLDIAIELCYRSRPFTSDEERLEHLFKLYEEMTAGENLSNNNQSNSIK